MNTGLTNLYNISMWQVAIIYYFYNFFSHIVGSRKPWQTIRSKGYNYYFFIIVENV